MKHADGCELQHELGEPAWLVERDALRARIVALEAALAEQLDIKAELQRLLSEAAAAVRTDRASHEAALREARDAPGG